MKRLVLLCALLSCAGCASLAGRAAGGFADNLSSAIRNQNDPETVRAAAPAYLLLMDSLLQEGSGNAELLGAAANFYALYGVVFVEEPERSMRLSERAREYGNRALCVREHAACGWRDMSVDEFDALLADLDEDDVPALYSFAISELAYLRSHSDDYRALIELPKLEAALEHVVELDESYEQGNAHVLLGVLNTLRPPQLGGQPEAARRHFERAIALSEGRDLGAKVEYARSYARLLYERGLHDRLLTEVVEADPNVPGLVLSNMLAQAEARKLLASADAYF